MVLDHLTPTQQLDIWQPRWKDRKVLLAKHKVGTHNRVTFSKSPTLTGEFYISGAKAATYPVESNGKIMCYCVDLDALEPLERR
jgi:hypothetical protein